MKPQMNTDKTSDLKPGMGDNDGRHELLLRRRVQYKLREIVITDEVDRLLRQGMADARIAQRAQLGFALS